MDPARSAAARDRAERQVFEALPELEAMPRRALALATLAEVPRAGIASEIGVAGSELSAVLAGARKALRRTRAELASGGRCERAEGALSDRLDGALAPLDERFLDGHLQRCARCRTHDRELRTALAELRAGFAERADPPRARLRVVPAPPLLPPAPEPAALEPAPAAPPAPTLVREPVVADHPAPRARNPAIPVAIAALIAVGLVAAAIALLMHFNGGASHDRAPWAAPDAPVVHPSPISAQ